MQQEKKIAYVLGTKAQFIKSKFILSNLVKNGFELTIIDTGQHKELTSRELESFASNYKYIKLTKNTKNISKITSMISWFIKIVISKHKVDLDPDLKYCLVHGDTISTLLGLIYSKRNNLNTIHIESGYRSNNWLKPFPEEIVRNIVTKYSNIVSVDGEEYLDNIKNIDRKKIIILKRNTIYDVVKENLNEIKIDKKNVLTVTIHRTENIYNKKKLKELVSLLIDIASINKFHKIQWFCHDITMRALKKNMLLKKLIESEVELKELVPHKQFLSEMINSKAVITDGGSIAEECSIVNQNTVIWRDVVENINYLNKNVILSNYDKLKIIKYLKTVNFSYPKIETTYSPSRDFVSQLIKLI
jgi:UDP-N-acetylglucosamine 2-epimerase (non-hydrolysing)